MILYASQLLRDEFWLTSSKLSIGDCIYGSDFAQKDKCGALIVIQIIYDIAEVREYGNNKYPDGGPDNWKRVEAQRYRDAAFRHFLKYIKDPESIDPESGIKHRKHLECNLAFLAEMEDGDE